MTAEEETAVPKFDAGDQGVVVISGEEVVVRVLGVLGEHAYMVQTEDSGKAFQVLQTNLLRIKGPFFDVRGLVYTTSSAHPDELGEIITLGKGPKDQTFFRIKYADGKTEWLSDDEVLLEAQKMK